MKCENAPVVAICVLGTRGQNKYKKRVYDNRSVEMK
jgi:hypothetical protein